jgi:hypothetical protein
MEQWDEEQMTGVYVAKVAMLKSKYYIGVYNHL